MVIEMLSARVPHQHNHARDRSAQPQNGLIREASLLDDTANRSRYCGRSAKAWRHRTRSIAGCPGKIGAIFDQFFTFDNAPTDVIIQALSTTKTREIIHMSLCGSWTDVLANVGHRGRHNERR